MSLIITAFTQQWSRASGGPTFLMENEPLAKEESVLVNATLRGDFIIDRACQFGHSGNRGFPVTGNGCPGKGSTLSTFGHLPHSLFPDHTIWGLPFSIPYKCCYEQSEAERLGKSLPRTGVEGELRKTSPSESERGRTQPGKRDSSQVRGRSAQQPPSSSHPRSSTSALFLPHRQLCCCFLISRSGKFIGIAGFRSDENPSGTTGQKLAPPRGKHCLLPSFPRIPTQPPGAEVSVTTVDFRTPLPRRPQDNAPPHPAQ
ncbi:uncharacterized protein LOC124100190 [Marmota monax]|uniref:uncharacterized protein LOC124100190 n=1 Tax=Marmota monax TaxID=9995 RepID=UPI0026EC89D2|nr:uncharacterized protein LOC124100190 [Marmota monax]